MLELKDVSLTEAFSQIESIVKELTTLKEIIMESPEKTLSLPLLRKDIDELKHKMDALAASTKDQIDRIYDFSKWFIALMITLVIGLVTKGFFY